MSKYTRQEASDLCNKLLSNMAVAKERSRAGAKYMAELEVNRSSLATIQMRISSLVHLAQHLDDIYANIQHYADEHQKTAKDIVNRAITEASSIVPDAAVRGAHVKYSGQHATIVNESGQSINSREGGGYRTSLGLLLRYALIKAQAGALPFMLLDESLFALSDTTTESVKEILMAMKKDISIIVIEQRRNVADGILDKEYQFMKDEAERITVREVQ